MADEFAIGGEGGAGDDLALADFFGNALGEIEVLLEVGVSVGPIHAAGEADGVFGGHVPEGELDVGGGGRGGVFAGVLAVGAGEVALELFLGEEL